ncbi:TBC1 domain family member 2B-like [Asterias rubens]|uniref:TBC1 domain family member 2B-like n=1 Tax=Asterias rubens TaxID=7604 RepID=UPI001455551B|nr:TBC1 domain family member 2B-like [Asterias rubens]
MAVPRADRKTKEGRKLRADLSMTTTASEVPTAQLISFDDETKSEGNESEMENLIRNKCSSTDVQSRSFVEKGHTPNVNVVVDAGCNESRINEKTDMSLSKDPNDTQKRGTIEHVKLCGYLNKMGERGIIKSYKSRWFVFDELRCRLYYYRAPQDLLPLGSIDIANATFNFEVNDSSSTGQFHICTGGRVYQLQAKDRQTMMFWLQELQERRRAYSQQRTSLTRDKSQSNLSPTTMEPNSGLISTKRIKERSGDPFKGIPPIFGHVEVPRHTIGESTAHTIQQTGVFNLSLTNLKTEFRNQITNFGLRRGASGEEAALINPATDCLQSDPTHVVKRPSSLNPTLGVSLDSSLPDNVSTEQGMSRGARGTMKAGFIKKFSRGAAPELPSPTAVWFENEPMRDNDCAQCRKFHQQLGSVQEELELVENEARASQEVITMLHKQLTAAQMEHSTNDVFLKCKTDQEKLLILSRKDKQLIQLEQLLQDMRDDRDSFREQLRSKEREVDQLNEQLSMFMEMVAAKDQIVMALTIKVHELEQNEPIRLSSRLQSTPANKSGNEVRCTQGNTPSNEQQSRHISSSSTVNNSTPFIDPIAYDKLKDACEAFETQNKFLNSEILELNHIREDDLQREKILFEQYCEMEAEFYKIQSKYLLLLDEMKTPKRGSGSSVAETDELISRLIEEALESDTYDKEQPLNETISNGKYDRFGFMEDVEESGDGEKDTLTSKAALAKRRSEQIQSQRSDHGISLSVKWENYMVQHGDRELTRTLELKSLVRQGIPHESRHRIWKEMVEWRVKRDKELTGPGYYEKLIKSEKFKMNPATKQIELDLLRTLPTNKNFDNIESKGIPRLRRVLKAYSVHNPAIGYCQGLNRLAGIGLLYLDEENAFWCLVAIIECIMPADYYSKTLIGSQTDQRVFKDLLAEKLPRLNVHLDTYGIDLSLVTFNWFITIFCDNIPAETMVRIWDTFLYEGNKVLFRFALAFFKMSESQLLKLNDYIQIFNFLRKMPSRMKDVQRLSQIAFHELNPFPRRHINNKRALHRAQVKQQLEELEKMRDEFVPQRTPSTEGADSDDDEDYDTVEALGGKQ